MCCWCGSGTSNTPVSDEWFLCHISPHSYRYFSPSTTAYLNVHKPPFSVQMCFSSYRQHQIKAPGCSHSHVLPQRENKTFQLFFLMTEHLIRKYLKTKWVRGRKAEGGTEEVSENEKYLWGQGDNTKCLTKQFKTHEYVTMVMNKSIHFTSFSFVQFQLFQLFFFYIH